MAKPAAKTVYSKVSVKSQTVLPREVRERLRIGPGDRLRYVLKADGARIEKEAPREDEGPFVAFGEGHARRTRKRIAAFSARSVLTGWPNRSFPRKRESRLGRRRTLSS